MAGRGSTVTTPIYIQNPQFMDYKVIPVAAFSPDQSVYLFPSVPPQQTTAVYPQYESSLPFYQTFLKGKPKALGIVLIISGIFEIALGVVSIFTVFTISSISRISFWGGITYVIAGALTIVAESKPNICTLKGSLALNIITAVFSLTAFILNGLDFFLLNGFYKLYYYEENIEIIVIFLLVIINLLLLSVSISVLVFGCRALRHEPNANPQTGSMVKRLARSPSKQEWRETRQTTYTVIWMFVIQNDVGIAIPVAPQPPPYSP